MNRVALLALGGATAIAAMLPPGALATTTAPPHVKHVLLIAVPQPSSAPPYFVVFSTDAPLKKQRDRENVLKYPGGVGIQSRAVARINRDVVTRSTVKHHWCYSGGGASYKLYGKLHVGHKYTVNVAVTNDSSVPETKRDKTLRRMTLGGAVRTLGC